MVVKSVANVKHGIVGQYRLATSLDAHDAHQEFLHLLTRQLFIASAQEPCTQVFSAKRTFGIMTCDAFPTVFAQPMRAFAWHIRQQWTCCLLSIAKGLVTDWALCRLSVEQCLVSFQILGKPLAAYRRHAFIRTVECKVRAFPLRRQSLAGTNCPHQRIRR